MRSLLRTVRVSRCPRPRRREAPWRTWLIATTLLAGCRSEVRGSDSGLADHPIHIAPRRLPCLEIEAESWRRLERAFVGCLSRKEEKDKEKEQWFSTPSLCLHTLRVRGTAADMGHGLFRHASELIKALTDSHAAGRAFGKPLLTRTMHGVRYRPAAVFAESQSLADENHIDQNLAGLAELGIPLSHPVRVGDWSGTVRDILNDATANYNVREPECEWSNITLLLYHAGTGSWRNKFGEQFDFEDMAADLLQRPTGRGSCAGLHGLYCLTMMARVQEVRRIVSDATHQKLLRHLRQRVSTAVARQLENGSWDRTWHVDPATRVPPTWIRQRAEDVLVTGHLIECMLYMPTQVELPTAALQRAGRWLLRRVLKAREIEIEREFCPFAHAAVCLRQLRL